MCFCLTETVSRIQQDRQVSPGTSMMVGPFDDVIILQRDASRAGNSMAPSRQQG